MPEGEEKMQAVSEAPAKTLPGSSGQARAELEAPLPQGQPGAAAGPGQKKKAHSFAMPLFMVTQP